MAKYRIEIDRDICISDLVCCEEAPNTFVMDDEDIAAVVDREGDPDETIRCAAESCPVDAIALYDEKTGERICPAAD
jgi:ferredoxin